MPGLSQYKPDSEHDNLRIEIDPPLTKEDPVFTADPEIFNRMKQRYEESLGFADLKRSAPGWLQHEIFTNTPRRTWDIPLVGQETGEPQEIAPGLFIPSYGDSSDPMTLRQIMELLNKLAPNEQQGP